jgi:peptidoglycan/xylan/chitin deacetylase (PgdA/CDA1 family)
MRASLRQVCKSSAAGLVHYSRKLIPPGFLQRLSSKEVCVFGLHRVLTKAEWSRSNSLDGMVITDLTFERLLEDLRYRFQIVSLEMILAEKSSSGGKPKPWCVLTFDDGWGDTYRRAYPSLRKFGLPATVFIATGSIEQSGGFWVEQVNKAWKNPSSRAQIESALRGPNGCSGRLGKLEDIVEWLKHMSMEKRKSLLLQLLPPRREASDGSDGVDSMMTWDQVVEMSHNGVEIGAHTVSHPLLTFENDETVESELRAGKRTLEQKVGKSVRSFAYPNGDCDPRVRGFVEQAGYECAFTTRPGWYSRRQDPYTIRRILVHEGNLTGTDGRYSPAMLSWALTGRV